MQRTLAGSVICQENQEEDLLTTLFQSYERVIVETLISSFGLELLIDKSSFLKDKHGGDVDTIHNVNQIGQDSQMDYKNAKHKVKYDNRGEYDSKEYHDKNEDYQRVKGVTRRNASNSGTPIQDAYEGKPLSFSKSAPPSAKASLDHVIAAKEVHDNRGRVLSGISGPELANREDNLKFTNASLNSSMQEDKISDYIKGGKPKAQELSAETKERMLAAEKKARADQEKYMEQTYYASKEYKDDVKNAALTKGLTMGVRQALGYLFSEVWFAVKEEWTLCRKQSLGFSHTLEALARGFKKGFETGMSSNVGQKFLSGSLAGVLASITTTVINRLHTTAKNTVKVIRQCWASITEALSILFLNPDGYFMGDRLSAVVKTISVGASVVLGTVIEEKVTSLMEPVSSGASAYVGNFVGALVTGLLSCSMLLFIDHDKNVKQLVGFLNEIPTIDKQLAYYKEQAQKLALFSAQIMEIDVETFQKETMAYQGLAMSMTATTSPHELNQLLKQHFQDKNITLPWTGEFDSFIQNKSNRLVFD